MINYRLASKEDMDIYFEWVNDRDVRNNAISSKEILFGEHSSWFLKKYCDTDTIMLIFSHGSKPVGQLRIEMDNEEAVISYSIDKVHRGKGYGTEMLELGSGYFFSESRKVPLTGFVKPENMASVKAFVKAGFTEADDKVNINGSPYVKFIKNG